MTLEKLSQVDLSPVGGVGFAAVGPSGEVVLPRPGLGAIEWIDAGATTVRTVEGLPGTVAAVVDETHGFYYVISSSGRLQELDAEGSLQRHLQVGKVPAGMSLDTRRRQLLVVDDQDARARLVDLKAFKPVGEQALSSRPAASLYDPKTDRHYVALPEAKRVATLTAPWGNLELLHEQIAVASSDAPLMLAVDSDEGHLYVGGDQGSVSLALLADPRRAVVRTQLSEAPGMLISDAARGRLFVTLPGEGSVVSLETHHFAPIDRIETGPECFSAVWDEKRRRLWTFLPKVHQALCFTDGAD